MELSYLGLTFVGFSSMLKNWWELLLAGILGASIIIGVLYIIYRICRWVIRRWRASKQRVRVPLSVAYHLSRLGKDNKGSLQRRTGSEKSDEELRSFGVYLGTFNSPPAADERRILSQWDVLVVDPLQPGVLEALSMQTSNTKHIIGRLDLENYPDANAKNSNRNDPVQVLDGMTKDLLTRFKRAGGSTSPFTGVLLANTGTHFHAVVMNKLADYIRKLGLDFWLELSGPDYLTELQCREIDFNKIRGTVYRNGTIRRDGDRQNYFQMAEMRTAMRGIAAQRISHGPPMFMWETVDDGAPLDYAVVQRCFNLCAYNSSPCWIGRDRALHDSRFAAVDTAAEKPLGALMWLKDETNMKAHDTWRINDQISGTPRDNDELYRSLDSFVPKLSERLKLSPLSQEEGEENRLERLRLTNCLNAVPPPDSRVDPLSQSIDGADFTGLGCFYLGLEVSPTDFEDVLDAQRKLRELNLLQPMTNEELDDVAKQLNDLLDSDVLSDTDTATTESMQTLLNWINGIDESGNRTLRVYVGLHSGFQTSSKVQFWGVYEAEVDAMVIYISKKSSDYTATILHTFLSSCLCTRRDCFTAELNLSIQNNTQSERWQLPQRLISDLEQQSSVEAVVFLRRLVLSGNLEDSLLRKLYAYCEYRLLDLPALIQLRTMASTDYLSGKVSPKELVTARLEWLRRLDLWCPDTTAAIEVFREVETRLYQVLMRGESKVYAQLGVAIQSMVQDTHLDAGTDIFALALFCAFRKFALNEIYLEVMDRNPYPNHDTDQPGCFAENFALGSRCDSFFDLTPRSLGKIIAERYRDYYMMYQPPARVEGFTELPTAYAAMQADLDPSEGQKTLPLHYRITFLGIFALPALIDILSLTIVGRGLYLTTYMSDINKTMATTALLVALLVCGASGSWISSGGTYYLYANAFPAMNMFVLTRFSAGMVVVMIVGILGLIGFGAAHGGFAGLIFLYYFAMLTTYLLTLSTLSIYQVPGTSFLSGRTVIIKRIPILFISPVLTTFFQHDILVYLSVLTIFLAALLWGARTTMSNWATWYLHIPSVTDAEVLEWYARTHKKALRKEESSDEILSGSEPRKALHAAVLRAHGRPIWTRKLHDPLVARLAKGYDSTIFLMTWYCKFKRNQMPLMYSPTWNLTLRAALEFMTNMQKGLKLHNAFLHWRHTGKDIWSGFMYFVVALLDKWVALVTGGNLVGLSAASSAEFRLAIGFGLCYYLIGAVSLDAVCQPLWSAANETTVQHVNSLEFLRQATINDAKARRRLYWRSLAKFFFLHIWGAAITAGLMWAFEANISAVAMYLAYLGAYSGLLWYQYNKIFCAMRGASSLTVAAIVGLPIGIALHKTHGFFAFNGVIALGAGTWVAGFHSFYLSKVDWPSIFTRKKDKEDGTSMNSYFHKKGADRYFASSTDHYPDLSQATIRKIHNYICALPAEERFNLDPSQHPAARANQYLHLRRTDVRSETIQNAFPLAEQMLRHTANLWSTGKTTVELVSMRNLAPNDRRFRSITRQTGDSLHIFIIVGPFLAKENWANFVDRDHRKIAEALIQVTSQAHFEFPHDHSMIAEILAIDESMSGQMIPERIQHQLKTSKLERASVITDYTQAYLRHLLLGVDCEKEWDNLPRSIRTLLLERSWEMIRPLSADEADWVRMRFCRGTALEPEEHVHRSSLGAILTKSIRNFAQELDLDDSFNKEESDLANPMYNQPAPLQAPSEAKQTSLRDKLKLRMSLFGQSVNTCVKFAAIALVADPEYQRELAYTMRLMPDYLRKPLALFLKVFWAFAKFIQDLILPMVILQGRPDVAKLRQNMKYTAITIKRHRIVIESLAGPVTCFVAKQEDGGFQLWQYNGRHPKQPEDSSKLFAINTYSKNMLLREREERKGDETINFFAYEYLSDQVKSSSKLPLQRKCLSGQLNGEVAKYDHRGYVTTGTGSRGVNPVTFSYWYRKSSKFEDELLRGEYRFPHVTIRVSWSMPPQHSDAGLDEWVPYTRVTEATFIEGYNTYHAVWTYEHKSHPEISTTLNGKPIVTPGMISDDWFKVLEKPKDCGFRTENPLLSFKSPRSNFLSRWMGLNVKRFPIPTSHARNQLWRTWRDGRDLDAVTARWLDERFLRSDSILRSYWKYRDLGFLDRAKSYLDAQADTIMARTDIDPEISAWLPIAYKISDLYSFGQGGDSTINTRTMSTQIRDSEEKLHILAMDTSTWPNEPGGVSACRRDMVNDLKTIKWHMVAEHPNDYGVPRFQIERNVQSLTILPLWGIDFLNPAHGIMENSLDSAVVERSFDTNAEDIKKNFLPILTSLVNCARTLTLTREHIEEATSALVDLNTYFETSRNWNDVWNHKIVKEAWREMWFNEDLADCLSVSKWWDFEKPTILQLDTALDMWHRYLFIFSLAVPEKVPDVFQASHHFTGATYGILCKVKRKCTLHVWDHCISFREFTTFMSSAVSFDSPFVNSSLISLGRLSCVLLEHHADVVLPCAAYFNPGWEIELGSGEGVLEHRHTFARKIDPVVNGIANMEKFEPVKQIKTDTPTAIMLSHIQYVKDIKNAIMATDVIVNKWGFKDYKLHIYGDMERAAGLSAECQELIASKGLIEHCVLKGHGNAFIVLQDAWLFLNSSISEGLPLAMGEAALTGCPVVCTDVGASFCVVTDSVSGDRFSEVVSPNDCESLARAQINILAMLGQWAAFADDAPGITPPILSYPKPTREEVAQITQRMYAKVEQRRALGMRGRNNVLKNFSADRYLREHEQMLWIGKYRSPKYRSRYSRVTVLAQSTLYDKIKARSPMFGGNGSMGSPYQSRMSRGASPYPMRSPRLPPESWVSLHESLNSPAASSRESLRGWMTKPKLSRRFTGSYNSSRNSVVSSGPGTPGPRTTMDIV